MNYLCVLPSIYFSALRTARPVLCDMAFQETPAMVKKDSPATALETQVETVADELPTPIAQT